MNWIEKWNTVVMDVLKKKNESENIIQSLWESFFPMSIYLDIAVEEAKLTFGEKSE